MALKKTVNTRFGIKIEDAYVKVTEIHRLNKQSGFAIVSSYVDANKSADLFFEQSGIDFPYDLNGNNPIKQAYEHIKTIPEFADAIDC